MDFEEIPTEAQPGFNDLIANLYQDFHAKGLRLYINTPVGDDDFDLKFLADHSDGLLLMNYDQHQTGSGPGPIAAQDWFLSNLKQVLKIVPKAKIICSMGSYGYDWTTSLPSPAEEARAKRTTQTSRWKGSGRPKSLNPGGMAGRFGRRLPSRARRR